MTNCDVARPEPRGLTALGNGGAASRAFTFALLVLVLCLGAAPAFAVEGQRVQSPEAGTALSTDFEVVAVITPEPGEVIDDVEARLSGSSTRTIMLDPHSTTDDGGQQWRGRFTVTGTDDSLANGNYRLEVRAEPLTGEPPAYEGHDVRLRVPPPNRPLTAGPQEADPRIVDLSWEPVTLPDFVAYRVQRRENGDGGTWATVIEQRGADQTAGTDTVPVAGEYRYRLIVVRSDGVQGSDGGTGEVAATSSPRGVRAHPDNPGTYHPPPASDYNPHESGSSTDPPGGPITRATTEPAADPASGDASSPAQQTPGQANQPAIQSPQGAPNPGSSGNSRGGSRPVPITPSAPPAPPPPVPVDDGVFDELLPFQATESEIEITETETAFIDSGIEEGGELNIYTERSRGQSRQILTATAGGLLLLLISGHLRRFLAGGHR